MYAILYTNSSVNIRAMVGSITLHVLLVFCLLFPAINTEMPMQVIEVTIAASPNPASVSALINNNIEKKPLVRKEEGAIEVPSIEVEEVSASDSSPAKRFSAIETSDVITSKPLFNTEYLRNPPPVYPAHAKKLGMEGVVMLRVLVTKDGQPDSISIAESSGFSLLDKSAIKAVSRWKFIPAKRGNSAVQAEVMVPIEFRLD